MKKVYSLVLVAVVLITSCSSPATDVIPIPKEAAQVINIHTASLSDKISLNEIFETSLFKRISNEIRDTSVLRLVKDPAASGLNTDKNITYFNVYKNGNNCFILGAFIADKSKFEQVVSVQIGSPVEGKDYKYTTKGGYFVAWNDKIAIQGTTFNFDFSKMSQYDEEGNYDDASSLNLTSTIAFLDEYFKASGKDLVNDSKHFKEALALGGDIQSYSNTTYAIAPYQMYLGMSKIGDLVKDNYTIANVSFENGKIISKSKSFLNDIIKKIAKKHFKNNANIDPLAKFGGKEVIAGFAFEITPEFITDLFKEAGFDGLANSFLQKSGISLDDIAQAFGNTIYGGLTELVTVPSKYYDFDKEEMVESTTSTTTEPAGAFGLEIRNKDYFKKVLNALHAEGLSANDSLIASNDKLFVVATSQSLANSILDGSKTELNEYAKKLKNTSGGFFVDFQKVALQLEKTAESKKDVKGFAALQKTFKGGYAIMEFEGGEVVGHFQVDFMNTNQNSLKSLVALLDELGQIDHVADAVSPDYSPEN